MSDPSRGALVVAVDPDGLFRSTDQGRTWQRIDADFGADSGTRFSRVRNDALDPRVLFVAVSKPSGDSYLGEVHRSSDEGVSWTRADAGLGGGRVLAIVSAADDGGPVLYAAACAFDALPGPCRVQNFLSRDRGNHWTELTNAPAETVILAARGAEVWAGGSGGLFRSPDEGETWTPASAGLAACPVTAFAFDPADPALLYAGTGENGARFVCGDVYRSVDSGMRWSATGLGRDMTAIVAGRGRVLAGAFHGGLFYPPGGLFESRDRGATWTDLELPSDIGGHQIAFGPGGRSIFAGTDSGLYRLPLATVETPGDIHPAPITPRDRIP